MSAARVFSAAAVCLLLAACRGEAPQGYFPLERGVSWQYRVERATPHERSEDQLRITNLGARELGNQVYYVRKTDTGNFYYLQQRENGVVLVSKRTIAERYPRADVQERFVFKQPVEVGARWSYQAQPHLIKRSFKTSKVLKQLIDYEMGWHIAAVDAQVEVPAGRFENCLHVQGAATIGLGRVLSSSKDEVTFTTDEWYAPDVGLVRLEYNELENSDQLDGGSITMELVAFEY